MRPLAEPRFGDVAASAGHYESYYLKAGDPDGSRAVWIRYTVHKRPGQPPAGSIWLTVFDRDAGRPRAIKQTAPAGELTTGPNLYVGVGDCGAFSPARADGRISGAGREGSWGITLAGDEPPLEHLPTRLYGTPLPRTKLLTLRPAALFSGWVEIDGRRVELADWPGMVGHNWGAQHAEQWVWLHGTSFDDRGTDTWIDMAMGRIKVGRWTTPWIANGAISLDGRRHQLGGIGRTRATRVDARQGHCEFELPGKNLTVSGTVVAPADDTVAW
ncbi:MAG: hypothetical protein JJE27_01750, partial [Thermoleophilia bacterium]|nr:hypothetical protein [Thermoleophilia bacterium]